MTAEVLVMGAGPAALCIASALVERGVKVAGVAPSAPEAPWQNTFGIWGPEVDALGLAHLLGHRWSHTSSYFAAGLGSEPVAHGIDYGLFDKAALQRHWLTPCQDAGVAWTRGAVVAIEHHEQGSVVTTDQGDRLEARLVLDCTGHHSPFLKRPDEGPVAGQAAYGIVGRFSNPPVEPGQFVLMDYRCDHLSEAERRCGPPTFLYAMDFGGGRFFVEETSLALAPEVPYDVLKARLLKRLAHRGIEVLAVEEEEFCLFPMNMPLPDLDQQLLAFGGGATLVHPASGYMIGALLRRSPALAQAIADGLADANLPSPSLARAAWQALWPLELQRKHALYRFGLEKLMRYPEGQLRQFFATFFSLPKLQWYGFLTNTLTLPDLVGAMLRLFAVSPWSVRLGLMQQQGREFPLMLRLFKP